MLACPVHRAFTEQPLREKSAIFWRFTPKAARRLHGHGSLQKPTEQNTPIKTLTKITN